MSDKHRSKPDDRERRTRDEGMGESGSRRAGHGRERREEGWNEQQRREHPGWSESGRDGSLREENARKGRDLEDEASATDGSSERRREFGAERGDDADAEQRRPKARPEQL